MNKPVSMIELFYDLVFVYMISKATGLIHHLHNGVIAPTTLLIFFFVVIVFINSWMIQSVFINRYGKSSLTDICFSFVNMMIVLYMSNAFSSDLHSNLHPFFIAAGLLSFTLCLQYILVYWQASQPVDRQIAGVFIFILGVRALTLLIAAWLPQTSGIILASLGIIFSWLAPSFTSRYTRHHPVIFSHLLERLTELSIILFGETIVGIANYFTRQAFSPQSVLIFITVAALFFTYITQFDHLIDEDRTSETGNLLIYLHYPVIFGISMLTVALKFIAEPEANRVFAVTFLYLGILLLYVGIWLGHYYNRAQFSHSGRVVAWFVSVTLAAYLICLYWRQFGGVVLVTATSTVLCAIYLARTLFVTNRNH